MEYQYHSQRFRFLPDGRRIGTVRVGDIIYLQRDVRPLSFPSEPVRREPWRVEGWIPREVVTMDPLTKQYKMVRCAGGHLALIRSLRDSRRTKRVADWILLQCVEAGLTRYIHAAERHPSSPAVDDVHQAIRKGQRPGKEPRHEQPQALGSIRPRPSSQGLSPCPDQGAGQATPEVGQLNLRACSTDGAAQERAVPIRSGRVPIAPRRQRRGKHPLPARSRAGEQRTPPSRLVAREDGGNSIQAGRQAAHVEAARFHAFDEGWLPAA